MAERKPTHFTVSLNGALPKLSGTSPSCLKCPLCQRLGEYHIMVPHLQSHRRHFVEHGGYVMYKCNLTCEKSSHYHCCYCSRITVRRDFFIKHLNKCKSVFDNTTVMASTKVVPSLSSTIVTPSTFCTTVMPNKIAISGTTCNPAITVSPSTSSITVIPSTTVSTTALPSTSNTPVIPNISSTTVSSTSSCTAVIPSTSDRTVISRVTDIPSTSGTTVIPGTEVLHNTSNIAITSNAMFIPTTSDTTVIPYASNTTVIPGTTVIPSTTVSPNTLVKFSKSVQTPDIITSTTKQKIVSAVPKKTKCLYCSLYLNKKNLKTHIQRRHSGMRPDITAHRHLPSMCIDQKKGIFAVAKTFSGPRIPIHVQKCTWGTHHQVTCDLEKCQVESESAQKRGEMGFECYHVRSLLYCPISTVTDITLSDQVLSEMVQQMWFDEDTEKLCLQRKQMSWLEQAPLSKEVLLGDDNSLIFISVWERNLSYYSRLGRVMVSYDQKLKAWHCPCSKSKNSCPHKNIAKWHLLQTRPELFK